MKKEGKTNSSLNEMTLKGAIGTIDINSIKKSIATTLIILFVGALMPLAAFALEVPSQSINVSKVNENSNSCLNEKEKVISMGEIYNNFNLENNIDFQGKKLNSKSYLQTVEESEKNKNMSDVCANFNDFNFESKKPEFRKWCEQNAELIKNKNVNESKAYARFYYETHREKQIERQKKYNEIHKEQVRERAKKYKETHKEQIREQRKKYKETHKKQQNEFHNDETYLEVKTDFQYGEVTSEEKLYEGSNYEFIKKLKNMDFKKWCMLNMDLIKNENMDRREAYARYYYETHREKMIKQHRKYYEEHKEKVCGKNKEYRIKHHKKILEICKKYNETHKERRKKYYETNKKRIRERQTVYRTTNKYKINVRRKVLRERRKAEVNMDKENMCIPIVWNDSWDNKIEFLLCEQI